MEKSINIFDVLKESSRYSSKDDFILKSEIEAAQKLDIIGYFLEIKNKGIKVKNASNSILAWVLGITDEKPNMDEVPIKFFLDLPDIDCDFPASHREEVIQYLRKKYGEDKTAQLITFNTFKPRAILADIGRVLKLPIWETQQAASQLIVRSGGDSRAEFCLADSLEQFDKVKKFFDKHPEGKPAIYLEGQVRQQSKHAAALVLSDTPLEEVGVLNNGIFSIDKAEEQGLLKIDILGLETLDILHDLCTEVDFDWKKVYDIPLDDQKVYDTVFLPARLEGIFQFDGSSVWQVTKDVKPSNFEQLYHVNALARPGAMGSGSAAEYIRRTNGGGYEIDPLLEPYTKDTLGIILFQEQVMQVVRNIGKLSWEDTGTIRKAMSKNLGAEFVNQFQQKFVKGAAEKGISEEKAVAIWKQVYTHGRWCISGDTLIQLVGNEKATIRELYRDRRTRWISYPNLENGKIDYRQLVDIYYRGKKEVWKLESSGGKTIKATNQHKFWTLKGWRKLKQLKKGNIIGVSTGVGSIGWDEVQTITLIGEEDVYDIAMPPPHHSYVANDFIVHNSFNLSHSVSYTFLGYWMAWFKTYYPAPFYARILKNKIDEQEIRPILKEFNGSFVPLDLNRSKIFFSVDPNDGHTLIGGFTNLKGIGEKAAERIVKGQPYDSIEDFKSRIPEGVAKKAEEALKGGILWADLTPVSEKVKDKVAALKLSSPLRSFTELMGDSGMKSGIVLGRVIHTNLKNHNEEEKILKRGFRINGPEEYCVLKVQDDEFNLWHICFDRYQFARKKQQLLGLDGKICLFKVNKLDTLLLGEKVKEL